MSENKKFGLTTRQAEASKAKFGTNALSVKMPQTFWQMYFESFEDIWIRVLCGAAVIQLIIYGLSFIYPQYFHQDIIELVGVAVAILLSTGVSTQQNYSNERQFNTLQAEASKIDVKVYRDGEVKVLPIDDIVKGDVILVQAGEQIPVDGILVKGRLKVSQASLNGESRDEDKVTPNEEIPREKIEDFDNPNWVFRGSTVTSGEALIEAVVIGDNTVLGGISQALGEDGKPSPTAEKMDTLGMQIGKLGMAGATISVIVNIAMEIFGAVTAWTAPAVFGLAIDQLMLFVSIIIMAVPEGLPLMSAMVASMNSRRMLKENILVRNSASIETAGYMNILFSDKTGTITEGVLSVVDWIDGTGDIFEDLDAKSDAYKTEIIKGIGLNNDALVADGKAVGSNGTDRALMNYLIGMNEANIDKTVITDKVPFDSQTKCAKVTTPEATYIKGAPDYFLDSCKYYLNGNGDVQSLTEDNRNAIGKAMHNQMGRSMRLLITMKEIPEYEAPILMGIVCIRDNVRKDVKHTVGVMNKAGCAVVMVTGDNAETAQAIAKEAGIIKDAKDVVLTSAELERMSDEEVSKIISHLKVVSRAKPLDKKRLVDLAQKLGYVVGMTGDGVNDSPALKSADVGFSMGDGTSVAKDASDIVIVNNSLTSICNALKYGRTMTKSVGKFLIFQLTVNVATILMNILMPLLGYEEPFAIVQILWINLIMDTLAAIAFGGEPALERYLEEKPISRSANVLTKYMKESIATSATYITLVSAVLVVMPNFLKDIGVIDDEMTRTFIFAFFIYAIIFNSLNTRSQGVNLFEHIGDNKKFLLVMGSIFVMQTALIYVAGPVFKTVALPLESLLIAMLLGLVIIPVDMLKKKLVAKQ